MEEIKPLVEEAKQAVGNIKASTLSEIRSLRAPPDVIRDVLEGVLCLMGTQDLSWNRFDPKLFFLLMSAFITISCD